MTPESPPGQSPKAPVRIALLSDTHLPGEVRNLGQLGPEIEAFLAGVDLILHAGDTVAPSVLDWLEQFAPLLVAKGNNDSFQDARMRPIQFLDIEGWRIGMTHDILENDPVDTIRKYCYAGEAPDIMVYGHTHYEALEHREGALIINSGSPILPHQYSTRLGTAGLLEITPHAVQADVVILGHSEGLKNPGLPMSLHVTKDMLRTSPEAG